MVNITIKEYTTEQLIKLLEHLEQYDYDNPQSIAQMKEINEELQSRGWRRLGSTYNFVKDAPNTKFNTVQKLFFIWIIGVLVSVFIGGVCLANGLTDKEHALNGAMLCSRGWTAVCFIAYLLGD